MTTLVDAEIKAVRRAADRAALEGAGMIARAVDLREVSAEECDPDHLAWDFAHDVINELAPSTRRDDWWAMEGPLTIIFRALIAARKAHR